MKRWTFSVSQQVSLHGKSLFENMVRASRGAKNEPTKLGAQTEKIGKFFQFVVNAVGEFYTVNDI